MDKICSYLGNYKKIIDLDDKKPADNISPVIFFLSRISLSQSYLIIYIWMNETLPRLQILSLQMLPVPCHGSCVIVICIIYEAVIDMTSLSLFIDIVLCGDSLFFFGSLVLLTSHNTCKHDEICSIYSF